MLWRPPDIEIDPAVPFENDSLGRESHVQNVVNLLANSPESIVLAVDGEWGAGKTTFLRLLDAVLRNQGHPTVMFNAWEVDFIDDPLIALLAEITEWESEHLGDDEIRSVDKVKEYGGKLLRGGLPLLIRLGTHGLIDVGDLDREVGELAEQLSEEAASAMELRLEQYDESKESVEGFRGALRQLVESTSSEEDSSAPMVFFVDELDRCRPDFALATLERIKHVFSVNGVSFVLGVNQDQLAHSIQGAYGPAFRGRRYLERLIDFRYKLPSPSSDAFTKNAFRASGLSEILDLHSERTSDVELMLDTLTALNTLVSSLRIQQKIIAHLNLVLRVTHLQTAVYPPFLALLITLRYIDPKTYDRFLAGEIAGVTVWEKLEEGGRLEFRTTMGAFIRACLVSSSGEDGEAESRADYLAETLEHWRETGRSRENVRAATEMEAEHRFYTIGLSLPSHDELELLDSRIELGRSFSNLQLN